MPGLIESERDRPFFLELCIADALGENAKNFEDLLDQVRKSDEEIANLRSSAEPISGDDPYRQSRPKDYLSGE